MYNTNGVSFCIIITGGDNLRKGINREVILSESEKMIIKSGFESFSMRALSERLGIKAASLYNHISGIDEIYEALAEKAAEMMNKELARAVKGKSPDRAFIDGALAYRRFAEKNRNMFLLLTNERAHKAKNPAMLGRYGFMPLIEVIKSYGISREDFLHFIRSFRAFIHGFAEITHNGFMQKGPASKEETYLVAVNEFLRILKSRGEGSC